MPNWCENRIDIVSDTKEQMDELVSFVQSKSDSEPFSFQSILPMPDELQEVGSPVRIVSAKEYKARDKETGIFPNQLITKAMSNKFRVEYGADNWYDWANLHWGTKWEVSDVMLNRRDDTEATYYFDTAWCPPEGIYHALVKRFPDVNISWFYNEEGMQIAGYLPD